MIEQLLEKRIKKAKSKALDLNAEFAKELDDARIPYRREFEFGLSEPTWIFHKLKESRWQWDKVVKPRRWTADFRFIDREGRMLLLEIDGSTQTGGRHNRGTALENQYVRDAFADIWKFRMIRVTRSMILSGVALDLVKRALSA